MAGMRKPLMADERRVLARSATVASRLPTIRGRAAVHECARLNKPNGWV